MNIYNTPKDGFLETPIKTSVESPATFKEKTAVKSLIEIGNTGTDVSNENSVRLEAIYKNNFSPESFNASKIEIVFKADQRSKREEQNLPKDNKSNTRRDLFKNFIEAKKGAQQKRSPVKGLPSKAKKMNQSATSHQISKTSKIDMNSFDKKGIDLTLVKEMSTEESKAVENSPIFKTPPKHASSMTPTFDAIQESTISKAGNRNASLDSVGEKYRPVDSAADNTMHYLTHNPQEQNNKSLQFIKHVLNPLPKANKGFVIPAETHRLIKFSKPGYIDSVQTLKENKIALPSINSFVSPLVSRVASIKSIQNSHSSSNFNHHDEFKSRLEIVSRAMGIEERHKRRPRDNFIEIQKSFEQLTPVRVSVKQSIEIGPKKDKSYMKLPQIKEALSVSSRISNIKSSLRPRPKAKGLNTLTHTMNPTSFSSLEPMLKNKDSTTIHLEHNYGNNLSSFSTYRQ